MSVDGSTFRPMRYGSQRAVYDFNHAEPRAGLAALGYLRNHLAALADFGDVSASVLVVVAHGNELHAFARANAALYPEAEAALDELAARGVLFRVCRNAARSRGYAPEDFYRVCAVVPAAVAEIAHWQAQGFSYMFAGSYARLDRSALGPLPGKDA
ncbi:MAG: DsrE family protein [Hyphomicrobiaceae bacterium]|nr:DsrE family protein [Hyphomicrobiaceae bacterium]